MISRVLSTSNEDLHLTPLSSGSEYTTARNESQGNSSG